MTMKPLADWPLAARHAVVGVLTDIDDTLTTQGVVTPDALHALQRLQDAGLPVVAITGRPIGWCEPLLRGDKSTGQIPLPVRACVAENGGAAWVWQDGVLVKCYTQDTATRMANRQRLQAVAQNVLRQVAGARLADDSTLRETDIAIDHSEHHHLPPDQVAQALGLLQAAGLHATVSSIHINAWLGGHTKYSGATWILRQLLGRDLDTERDHWAYVGDSANDQVMFARLPNSVGVANIRHATAQMQHLPRWVTQGERGAGFAEVADALLVPAVRTPTACA